MASTYTAIASGVTVTASAKVFLQLFKDATSSYVMKVYRIYAINVQTATVTGTSPVFIVQTHTTLASGGSPTVIVPVKHDSSNPTITSGSGGWTINTGNTSTGGGTSKFYRRLIIPTDEITSGGAKIENFNGMVPTSVIWDAGYGESRISPLTFPTLTAGGVSLYTAGIGSPTGTFDIVVEFTLE